MKLIEEVGNNPKVRVVAEGGIRQHAPGGRDTTAPDLNLPESGNSCRVGVITAYFLDVCKVDRIQGRGEAPGAMVAADGS